MQLKKVKLAGFKSFVDPTVLEFKSQLVGVVGPNGCGKSNVIDAVRWVMGESSAKNLRGQSMTDVIFNGSSSRKPVGQASIDLIFDNREGKVGGEYAKYAEISIRREVSRDGQSNYYLNNTKCRRKDITDVFLGTGLGPRSYSIIEQGMISRVIESKPEDLRVFFEEAAGISKYKQRRHETELRMRHTRENLERLEDLRQEQIKTLEKLKRQSQSATKYNEYKREQDQIDAELTALRWVHFDEKLVIHKEQISELATALEERLARRASIDSNLETLRSEHMDKHDVHQEVQSRFYGLGAEIARHEQSLKHHLDKQKQLQEDAYTLETALADARLQLTEDQDKLHLVEDELSEILPQYEMAAEVAEQLDEKHQEAQQRMEIWHQTWEEFQAKAQEPAKRADVEKVKIEQFERTIREAQIKIDRLQQEQSSFNSEEVETVVASLQEKVQSNEFLIQKSNEELEKLEEILHVNQGSSRTLAHQLDTLKENIQANKGRQASLEALQQAALGQSNEATTHWLSNHNLDNCRQVIDFLTVEPGWEHAVEVVLGEYLEAICVDSFDDLSLALSELEKGKLTFFANQKSTTSTNECDKLSSVVKTELEISHLLNNVFIVENINDAIVLQKNLQTYQSIITKSGIWFGPTWVKFYKAQDAKQGVIQREQELKTIETALIEAQEQVHEIELQLEKNLTETKKIEEERRVLREVQQTYHKQLRADSNDLSREQARLEHIYKRLETIELEIKENQDQAEETSIMANESRQFLEEAIELMSNFSEQKKLILLDKEQIQAELSEVTLQNRQGKEHLHSLALKKQSLESQATALNEAILRLDKQIYADSERLLHLQRSLSEDDSPEKDLRVQLELLLADRLTVEEELSCAKNELDSINNQVSALEKERSEIENKTQHIRDQLDNIKMEWQSLQVRKETLNEKLAEMEKNPEELVKSLPKEANEVEWATRLNTLTEKIERLGAINLAAIDEYEAELERHTYLESQYNDLTEALETLESAIRKIDKETRATFKETFETVNAQFKVLFPKLFGGGEAYLELTGDDLLESGVSVMARPPGKRNSSIHLLSGGEKALTAVSLVFAIFQLNPAPFCMLDEVDAPLDDANVGRFCEMLKEMSSQVQFIFITHNKITMEIANQLAGVTMKEPGVSRLVSVDIDEAIQLAEA